MLNSIKLGFIVLLTLFTSLNVQAAGGIALGATRVIYPSAAKQTSLAISNSDTQERYLVNSWIENSAGQKEKTFIVTPPLFVSEPKSENTLRIIYAGQPLPGDRESLFWMNVKAIPSVDKSHIEGKKRSATGDSVAHQTVRASGEFAADAGRRADLAEIFPCRQPSQDNQPICLLPHAGQYQRGREKD